MSLFVKVPTSIDVLCGRGQVNFHHEGNRQFRLLIAEHLETYKMAQTKKQKMQVIRLVADIVIARGGRFLVRCNDDWLDGGRKQGRTKTGHAFRDALRGRVKCITDIVRDSNSDDGSTDQDIHDGNSFDDIIDNMPLESFAGLTNPQQEGTNVDCERFYSCDTLSEQNSDEYFDVLSGSFDSSFDEIFESVRVPHVINSDESDRTLEASINKLSLELDFEPKRTRQNWGHESCESHGRQQGGIGWINSKPQALHSHGINESPHEISANSFEQFLDYCLPLEPSKGIVESADKDNWKCEYEKMKQAESKLSASSKKR